MEVAVGVGGWHNDGVGLGGWVLVGDEGARGFPEGVDGGFELVGFVGFTKFHGSIVA